jgi:hypothetical protein
LAVRRGGVLEKLVVLKEELGYFRILDKLSLFAMFLNGTVEEVGV